MTTPASDPQILSAEAAGLNFHRLSGGQPADRWNPTLGRVEFWHVFEKLWAPLIELIEDDGDPEDARLIGMTTAELIEYANSDGSVILPYSTTADDPVRAPNTEDEVTEAYPYRSDE